MIYFTSSWDDGCPSDLKLADLLDRYEQQATFYVPLNNVENRKVMSENEIARLSERFEIGAHTMNHRYLNGLSAMDAKYEIRESKAALEAITGKPVNGFCFPGGKFSDRDISTVKDAGFVYARTVNQFRFRNNALLMDTTLQAYNHSSFTYVKHLLKRRYLSELITHFDLIRSKRPWNEILIDIIKKKQADQSDQDLIIHLWGHSWELEEKNMWKQLEEFLVDLRQLGLPSLTNLDAFKATQTAEFQPKFAS